MSADGKTGRRVISATARFANSRDPIPKAGRGVRSTADPVRFRRVPHPDGTAFLEGTLTRVAAGEQRVADLAETAIPLVRATARRVARLLPASVEYDDLVQDGALGALDAAERFDEAQGVKFETFAEGRIRGAMVDALRKQPGGGRHPRPQAGLRRHRRR